MRIDRPRFERLCPRRNTSLSGHTVYVDAATLRPLPPQGQAEEYIKDFVLKFGHFPTHGTVRRDAHVGHGTAVRARQCIEADYNGDTGQTRTTGPGSSGAMQTED